MHPCQALHRLRHFHQVAAHVEVRIVHPVALLHADGDPLQQPEYGQPGPQQVERRFGAEHRRSGQPRDTQPEPGQGAAGSEYRRCASFALVGFGGAVFKGRQFLGAVLARAVDRPHDRTEQDHGADIKGKADGIGYLPRRSGIGDAQPVAHHPRQCRGDHRAQRDEETLHHVARGTLTGRQHVADEGPERFHGDVDGCIQNPQRPRRHPQRRRIGHHHQRQRREYGPEEEIRPPPPEKIPGAVAHVADDGLHHQARQRCCHPEQRQRVHVRPQGLEDPAGVGVLEREPELDAQKAEAHVPDLPEAEQRSLFGLHYLLTINGVLHLMAIVENGEWKRLTARRSILVSEYCDARTLYSLGPVRPSVKLFCVSMLADSIFSRLVFSEPISRSTSTTNLLRVPVTARLSRLVRSVPQAEYFPAASGQRDKAPLFSIAPSSFSACPTGRTVISPRYKGIVPP